MTAVLYTLFNVFILSLQKVQVDFDNLIQSLRDTDDEESEDQGDTGYASRTLDTSAEAAVSKVSSG